MHIRNRTFTAVVCAMFAISLAAAPSVAAGSETQDREEIPAATAYVYPMQEVEGTPERPLSAATDHVSSAAEPLVVTLPAGTAEEQHASLEEQVDEFLELREGQVGPAATDKWTGNCGWSSITLNPGWGAGHTLYVKGTISLNKPGYAYRTNIMVFSSAALDFLVWNFPETGSLNGARSWWDDFQMTVPKMQKYGASLNRAEVYVGNNSWCHTLGPHVDGVYPG